MRESSSAYRTLAWACSWATAARPCPFPTRSTWVPAPMAAVSTARASASVEFSSLLLASGWNPTSRASPAACPRVVAAVHWVPVSAPKAGATVALESRTPSTRAPTGIRSIRA